MDPRFLRFYEDELAHIRQTAGEFARQFPKIAGRLALDPDGRATCPDPFVERLLEGFAFLTARVQLKLAAEFPTFTQTLLDTVYPQFLCPLPSATIVRFEPEMSEGSLAGGYRLDRGTVLRSHPSGTTGTACEYRTAHDVTLWPLQVRDVRYHSPRELGALEFPAGLPAKAAIAVKIGAHAGTTLDQLATDSLVFHLRGNGEVPVAVYENLFARRLAVFVGFKRGGQTVRLRLPDECVVQRGMRCGDALLPLSPRSFEGYRLLQEYFMLPARFLFVEVTGLRSALRAAIALEECELIFTFNQPDARLENTVEPGCFELNCTPAINLFERRCDCLPLDGRVQEHPVIPDRTHTLDYEIYQLRRVVGLGMRAGEEQPFEPFFHARDRAGERAFYTVRRATRVLSMRERELGAVSGYPGVETWISLVDSAHAPYHPSLRQLSITADCTNRHLPLQMPVGIGTTDFTLEVGAPVRSVRCLTAPTPPRPSHAIDDELAWRFISHLSLNYLSLVDHDSTHGAVALRELVRLYADGSDVGLRRQVEGLRSMTARPVVRRVFEAGPVAFARGLELTLKMRETEFKGVGAFLLGAVLEHFFAKYTGVNSFTETVVTSEERGELIRWPIRLGRKDQL